MPRVMVILTPLFITPPPDEAVLREIVQSVKTAAYFALSAPVAILLGLIPFLGPVLALGFTGHRVAFQNTDAVLLRRAQSPLPVDREVA